MSLFRRREREEGERGRGRETRGQQERREARKDWKLQTRKSYLNIER